MAEEYQKSRRGVATGYLLRVITAYNLISTLSAPASGQEMIVSSKEAIEYHFKTEIISGLPKTLEINPTQVDIFYTLMEDINK